MLINWSNFIITVSEGIGMPEEKGRDQEWSTGGAVRTQTIFID